MALQAGGALPENLTYDINSRGLSFRPDQAYVAELRKAGANDGVIAVLQNAKVLPYANNGQSEADLLHRLAGAANLIKAEKYDEAATQLNAAISTSFANAETGFVMGELLRRKKAWQQAADVYEEVLRQDSAFPEVHTKFSYILYKLDDGEGALHEAKTALAQNPQDGEAHKNAGLALSILGKLDASKSEYMQALAIKPDYAVVHYDLGLLLQNARQNDEAIREYRKAVALDPNIADYHGNLGVAYDAKGDVGSAVSEYREAKRLNPNDPMVRQNLASALMTVNPRAAIAELKELEKVSPDFEMCHVCLAKGLAWAGDIKGAQAEFHKAVDLDPADTEPHSGLAELEESQKNYDAALDEFRFAEKLDMSSGKAHRDVARILLAKKDPAVALAELKIAESLSPSDWNIHDLYGKALDACGQEALAISEFKEAVSLEPRQIHVRLALASVYEKKGDWVLALDEAKRAALNESSANSGHQPGETFMYSKDAQTAYKTLQRRFSEHISQLKLDGKTAEAADLQDRVRAMDESAGTSERVQQLMQSAHQAFQERRFEDAEKGYKQAVELAGQLPPGDENLIVALKWLGMAYSMRQDYADADVAWHRQMAVIEKTFGASHPRMTDPLMSLGSTALGLMDYAAANSYYSRALAINQHTFGENSSRTVETLRAMAGFYEVQSQWEKAEPFLLRAVRADEMAYAEDNSQVLIPLWGLCDLYDRWGKPEKSQPCWYRATALMEKQVGENSPQLAESITAEAKALRQLGRNEEAATLERRLATLRAAAVPTN